MSDTKSTLLQTKLQAPKLSHDQIFDSDESDDSCFLLVPPPQYEASSAIQRLTALPVSGSICDESGEHAAQSQCQCPVDVTENDDETFVLVPPLLVSQEVTPDLAMTLGNVGLKPRRIPEVGLKCELAPSRINGDGCFVEVTSSTLPMLKIAQDEEPKTDFGAMIPYSRAFVPTICFTPPRGLRLPMRPSFNPFDINAIDVNEKSPRPRITEFSTSTTQSVESETMGSLSITNQLTNMSTPNMDMKARATACPLRNTISRSCQQHGQSNVSPWNRRTIRVPMI
jgi:hypothetical protein